MIDVDDVQRKILVELTEPFPESLGELLFISGMIMTDVILDATYSILELTLLPGRVLGVIK